MLNLDQLELILELATDKLINLQNAGTEESIQRLMDIQAATGAGADRLKLRISALLEAIAASGAKERGLILHLAPVVLSSVEHAEPGPRDGPVRVWG